MLSGTTYACLTHLAGLNYVSPNLTTGGIYAEVGVGCLVPKMLLTLDAGPAYSGALSRRIPHFGGGRELSPLVR